MAGDARLKGLAYTLSIPVVLCSLSKWLKYHIISYDIVLYHIILHCTILHHITLHCITSNLITLHCITSHLIKSYCIVFYSIIDVDVGTLLNHDSLLSSSNKYKYSFFITESQHILYHPSFCFNTMYSKWYTWNVIISCSLIRIYVRVKSRCWRSLIRQKAESCVMPWLRGTELDDTGVSQLWYIGIYMTDMR